MSPPFASPVGRSSMSEVTLPFGDGAEVNTALALPSSPHHQRASYPTYATLQITLPNSFIAQNVMECVSSALYTSVPPAPFPLWNNTFFGNNDHSALPPILGQSEVSPYGTQEASGDRATATDIQSTTPHERERGIRHVFPSATTPASTGRQSILHPEHVVSWYLMCWNAVIVNGPRQFVPQTIYEPHSQGDKERYVSLANLQPPIIFLSRDSPEWGIPITQLLSKQFTHLVDGDKPAFTLCGPSMGIRVQWPGYQPCHKQVSTRDYTSERRVITKTKLAQIVAKCVKQFMDGMSEQPMQVGSDRRWRVGPCDVRVDDIILVSLHHVSQGSWQPQLRLRRVIRADSAGARQQS